jgi:hypothetical protein
MFRFFFTIAVITGFISQSVAQSNCTPLTPSGMPGVTPPTENLACVERGIPFSEVIYIENFNTFNTVFGTAQLNYLKLDSFINLPCDLQWSINPRDSLGPAETACINIFGTSNDSVGQYRVRIYVTVDVFVPGFGNLVLSDEAEALVQQVEQLTGTPTGINFKYYLRVIEPGHNCPVLDTTSGACNLTACSTSSVAALVSFSEDTICSGGSATLQANVTGGTPPYTYSWSPGNVLNDSTIANPVAIPDTTTTFVLTVFDCSGKSITEQNELVVETCIGIENKTSINSFTVYPNPSQGIFSVNVAYAENKDAQFKIAVTNLQGITVYSENVGINKTSFNKSLNLEDLPKGIYFLHLNSELQQVIKKIVIK